MPTVLRLRIIENVYLRLGVRVYVVRLDRPVLSDLKWHVFEGDVDNCISGASDG